MEKKRKEKISINFEFKKTIIKFGSPFSSVAFTLDPLSIRNRTIFSNPVNIEQKQTRFKMANTPLRPLIF